MTSVLSSLIMEWSFISFRFKLEDGDTGFEQSGLCVGNSNSFLFILACVYNIKFLLLSTFVSSVGE